ncbi:MAG TPA: OmpA family protein [Allosphingosinicella sp.]
MPIFFENGRRDIDATGLNVLATHYDWVLDRAREDVRIVLTANTREPYSAATVQVAFDRAEAVRAVLVADGVPADHIFVARDYGDGPNFAPEGWIGGWVYPDFYVSPAVLKEIIPDDGTVC